MTKTVYPFINKFSGEVKVLPKNEGALLNEDWARAKVTKNKDGERVFRFQIATSMVGPDGKEHQGVATVDLSEVEVESGNGSSK